MDLQGIGVLVGDHHVGAVAGFILDPVEDTVLGFEVESHGGRRYFLPLALTMLRDGALDTASPLHLVDDVDYYRHRGRRLDWPQAAGWELEWVSGRVSAREPAA
jgi:hypothetical protein